MSSGNINHQAAGLCATRTRAYADVYVRPWQHGAMDRGVHTVTRACMSIAFDVLRTVKGGIGSSG